MSKEDIIKMLRWGNWLYKDMGNGVIYYCKVDIQVKRRFFIGSLYWKVKITHKGRVTYTDEENTPV